MKTLPVGRSTLQVLRENNAVYVDKTQYVHRLINTSGRVYFLSRPRRFGKSLLIDTFKQLFLGNREVFEGTWIGEKGRYEWAPRPVLHLDFSQFSCTTVDTLKTDLLLALERTAEAYGVSMSGGSLQAQLASLIRSMAAQGSVVVLVDEYDAPIIKNILAKEVTTGNRELLREFYTALKSLDSFLHFVFLTGVSKFAKTSIFLGMNNLNDISMMPEYAAACGYTHEELEFCFADYINEAARSLRVSRDHLLQDMRFWYNGYRFSMASIRVYNPFSILLFLERKFFSNYWFETGTPRFLIELIQNTFEEFQMVEEVSLSPSAFSASEIENLSLITLLYQTGYVTIKDYAPEAGTFTLTYPNEEVRQSFSASLLGGFISKNALTTNALFNRLRAALRAGDAASFCQGLQSVLASIPYNIHINRESYYHTILHTVGLAVGGVLSESATSLGRIDLVVQAPQHVFVMELKIDASAEKALAQIKDRRYYEPFMSQSKAVYLIGLNLDFAAKQLAWIIEALAE